MKTTTSTKLRSVEWKGDRELLVLLVQLKSSGGQVLKYNGNMNKKILQSCSNTIPIVCIINSSVSQLVKYIATYSCEIKIPFHLNYAGVRVVTQSH